MEPLEQAVAYIKRGLRQKQPLDQLRISLRQSGFEDAMIHKAAFLAIEALEAERQAAQPPPTLGVTDALQSRMKVPERHGHPAHLLVLVFGFVGLAVFLGMLRTPGTSVGKAAESFLARTEFENYCVQTFKGQDSEVSHAWCKFLTKHVDDYLEAEQSADPKARRKVESAISAACFEKMALFFGLCKNWEEPYRAYMAFKGAAPAGGTAPNQTDGPANQSG